MNRPSYTRAAALAIPGVAVLLAAGPFILGIRGYYKDTMGKPGQNDRGIYDDAAFIIGPAPDEFRAFNWNTDPSGTRKGMAVLQSGEYAWAKGIHGRHHITGSVPDRGALKWLDEHPGQDHPDPKYRLTYWAFRQAGPFTLLRDGADKPETITDPANWPWIDGHHGGLNGTSSEGCQTVPLEQWKEMRAYGYGLMDKYSKKIIPYKLIEQ